MKLFFYMVVVLYALNPFMLWLVSSMFAPHNFGWVISTTAFFFLLYPTPWRKLRRKFPELDKEGMRIMCGS